MLTFSHKKSHTFVWLLLDEKSGDLSILELSSISGHKTQRAAKLVLLCQKIGHNMLIFPLVGMRWTQPKSSISTWRI
jgi:hypothetical protein